MIRSQKLLNCLISMDTVLSGTMEERLLKAKLEAKQWSVLVHSSCFPSSMSKHQRRALTRIKDYLLDDERRHYEESGRPRLHIYHDICDLESLLNEVSH